MCTTLNMHVLRMYVYIDAPIVMGVLHMYVCMHVCMHYVCMYVCMYVRHLARYSARLSLFVGLIGVLIGTLGGIDVYQVKYACIMHVCIYQRADNNGSTIYVCLHACMYVVCMYSCMYADRSAGWY